MAYPKPDEFLPLPYYPYDSRPESMPLSNDEAATALYLAKGDLKAAAALLKVTVVQLKKPIRKDLRLQRLIERLHEPGPTDIRLGTVAAPPSTRE
jgi:hypothetical protein